MRATSRAVKFVGGASEIARYYGFRSLSEIAPEMTVNKLRAVTPAEAASLCAAHTGNLQEPILAFYATPGASGEHAAPARESGTFSIQIVGSSASISEIHILKTLEAIIAENGGSFACARINSVGDKDSRARFARELSTYLRRHADAYEPALSATERTHISENPLFAYRSKQQGLLDLLRDAPRPVHYLSEKSRTHFRQVLEHLERVEFPYVIDDMLVGLPIPMSTPARATSGDTEPKVIFRLELENDAGMLTATVGGRYDELASRPGGRGSLPAVHAAIEFRSKAPFAKMPLPAGTARPKIYFIQFGDSARLTGFSVIDTLRRAHIPVGSQFDTRHLAPQLSAAQGLGVPYVLIMGAREALDQTVIIRTLATSAQTIVPIGELPRHLRALKLV